jgi:hypothetical protein
MENENENLKCYCCNEDIQLTKENKINKHTTVCDGDFFHKSCYMFEKYGKPYKKPNRKCYN